ncbi:MAG: BadF/BadG/BcrA/BcrD ATPase family protein, partial [Candidatus Limnocylindrales bacterium]
MSRARFLLGLDGGNTKTIALVGRLDGTIVGAARVHRSSDIYTVSLDAAVATFHDVADRALADAGASDSSLAAAAFSLAGADWPEDFAVLDERLDERWPIRSVVNDAMGALAAAIPKGPGVVIACGTGTATGARGIDGRTWHASFWQEPQGAYELGVRTLRAVYRAELGIDPPTDLTGRVLTATGERDVESLL